MGRRLIAGAALSAAVVLVLTACGGGSSSSGSSGGASQSSSGKPQDGGTLRMIFTAEPSILDPLTAQGASGLTNDSLFQYSVFDALLSQDVTTGKLSFGTAQALDSSDGLHWTLKLKSGITFSDGTVYDADAVKYNWERIGDPANKSPNASAVTNIASMSVTDPQTLAITLKSPNFSFASLVARRIPFIGSPTAIKAKGKSFGTAPVGAGPFLLSDWAHGSQMSFTKNPNYWNKGLPHLDKLVVSIVQDDQQRVNSFKAGEAEISTMNLRSDLGKKAKDSGTQTVSVTMSGGSDYVINTKKAPFDDIRARQAFAMAIDYNGLNQTVFSGANEVPTSLFVKSSPYYDASITTPAYDKAKAQQLFDQLFAEKGAPMTFTLIGTPANQANMEYVQTALSQYQHVKMDIKIVASSQILPLDAAGNFQVSTNLNLWAGPEPEMYDLYHSNQARNFTGYSTPQMDAALDDARTTNDAAKLKDDYKVVQQQAVAGVSYIFFSRPTLYYLLANTVHGVQLNNDVMATDQIWLSK